MSRLSPALVAGVVIAVTGCGAGAPDIVAGSGLSRPETRWTARWAAWSAGLGEALRAEAGARLAAIDDPDGYRTAVRPLVECVDRLARRVGPGPTARTEKLAVRLRTACHTLARTVTRVADAYAGRGDPVAAVVSAAEALGRVETELLDVEQALEGYSLARRPLPEASGSAGVSRVDRVLEDAAEQVVAGFDLQVRCWSAAEWPRMISEERALSNGLITVDSTGAFANTVTREVNMQTEDCDRLSRAADTDEWWPRSERHRLGLAWSLAVLSHEAQHLTGALDEAETECRGQQRVAEVAVALGAPSRAARALAELGWTAQYPDLDSEYTTDLCRDGGPYDLRPGSAGRWPWG